MKITIVQGAFFPIPPWMGGAVEKVWFALGKEFAHRGHDVTHISRKYNGLPDEEFIEKVRHIRVSGFDTPKSFVLLKFYDFIYTLNVLRVLPKSDILVTNTFWLPILLRTTRYGKIYVHVARYPKGQMHLYRHAARLQTVSKAIQKAIINEVPDLASKICCIPYPIPEVSADTSQQSKNQKIILYVGRIHPEKGLHLLLQAITLIPQVIFSDWKLVIVGPSEIKLGGGGNNYLEELKCLSDSIKDRIEWKGPIFDAEELNNYYRKAILFIYPSLAERGETFGLAPLEAMAFGCPALVSDLECFKDFIEENVTGFSFNHRLEEPIKTLANKITELLKNEKQLNKVGKNALQKAKEYTIDHIAGLYLADFESILRTSYKNG